MNILPHNWGYLDPADSYSEFDPFAADEHICWLIEQGLTDDLEEVAA